MSKDDYARAEEWRPVIGYDGLYEVSDQGRVRSLPRRRVHPLTGVYTVRGRILAQGLGRRYPQVVLRDSARQQQCCQVHRLVLDAFIGPCPAGMEGCHRNDVKTDNQLQNLYWGTPSENGHDRVRNGNQRNQNTGKTQCDNGHEFTAENTYVGPSGRRDCRKCLADRQRTYRNRRAAA